MLQNKSRQLLLLFLVLLLGAACTAQPQAQSTAVPSATPVVEEEEVQPTATAEIEPTEEEQSEEPVVEPAVTVQDQELGAGNTVTVPAVSAAQPGWVVIHSQQDGGPGPVLGQTAVPAGESSDVQVEIDAEAATETIYAMLHVDAGTEGTYEFPGEDVPATDSEGNVVVVPFQVTGLTSETEEEAASGGARIATNTHEELGTYLTDREGLSFYLFLADEPGSGSSTCYGACAEAWPPVLTGGAPDAASEELDPSLLDTIEREDGFSQVTYNGWPLYTFVADQAPGDINGQGVDGFGGEWYLVTPAGEPLREMVGATGTEEEVEEEEEIEY